MAWVSKEQWQWLESHGRRNETGWACRKTGADINALESGRSVHVFGMSAGFGEVRPVLHLYCTGCNPDYQPPPYGTPIQENELLSAS